MFHNEKISLELHSINLCLLSSIYTGRQTQATHSIYIYIERERERERESNLTKDQINVAISKAFFMHKKEAKH